MTLTVIIVTLNRPDCVRRCLQCLARQDRLAEQVIVVDASADQLTRDVVTEFPGTVYVHNENGFGRMTASRNLGLKAAGGEIIAFIDDDAFACPEWASQLLETYDQGGLTVGAVGGRALNRQPNEATEGVTEIGKLKRNGMLTGYFAADPGKTIEVDHLMGCNMSYRREVLIHLGGFREDCTGISGVREDSDMCLRVGRAGHRLLFNPRACVDHLGAPQAVGQRFDTRYAYYGQRNHLILLMRNFGPWRGIVWRYLGYALVHVLGEFIRKTGGAFIRLGANFIGVCMGGLRGLYLLCRTGTDPVRHDPGGIEIAEALRGNAEAVTSTMGDPASDPVTTTPLQTSQSAPSTQTAYVR